MTTVLLQLQVSARHPGGRCSCGLPRSDRDPVRPIAAQGVTAGASRWQLSAARGEHVVDQLSRACGCAQADGFETSLLWPDGISGVDDELLAELIYRGGATKHGRASDAEVLQDALDGAGKLGASWDSATVSSSSRSPFAESSPSPRMAVRARLRMWLGARTSAATVATAASRASTRPGGAGANG
jgi:hypothetical protein